MTYPGDRLRRMAVRAFSATTMERLIDPVLADLQTEYADAVEHGLVWTSRSVRLAGYLALLKVIVWHACRCSIRPSNEREPDDQLAVRRTVGWFLAATTAATLALELPFLLRTASRTYENRLPFLLYVYLVPSQLLLAVPVGLTLGILYGLRGLLISRRSQGTVLAIAVVCSVASFVTAAWILPAANQAFRATVIAIGNPNHASPPAKGLPELTLAELGQRIDSARRDGLSVEARSSALTYHMRWALSCSPLILAFFALSLVSRRRGGRCALGAAACGVLFLWYVFMFVGRVSALGGSLPPFAAAWLPNALIFGISVVMLRLFPQRSGAPALR